MSKDLFDLTARTALVTTAGFRDSLEMAYENRFEQYDMYIEKPAPLVARRLRLTVPERMNAKGQPLVPLDEAAVHALAGARPRHRRRPRRGGRHGRSQWCERGPTVSGGGRDAGGGIQGP